MIKLFWQSFIRSGVVVAGVPVLLLVCMLSILTGKEFVEKQSESITEAAELQKVELDRYVDSFADDIGYMLYYAKFSLVNEPSSLGGLSIGQRDVNPTTLSLTIRNIESQKYDSDLNNPYNQLIGHIDFSFVLIFLFPLIIIAFTYNLLSEQKEAGTWKLVMIQASRPALFVVKLLSIRILAVVLLFMASVFIAGLVLQTGFGNIFWKYVIGGLMYLLMWFSICFLVVSLQKSSNQNAQILLSVYLLLLIVLPAFINSYLQQRYPVPEALEVTLKQRKAYHEKWDTDKLSTMTKFYGHYPEFEQYDIPDTDFSWPLYYAMQQLGDDESSVESAALVDKLEQRIGASQRIAYLLPSLHLQLQFNRLTKSDLENHLHFMEAATDFHEKIRLHFYPKIFRNMPATSEDWNSWIVEYFNDEVSVSWMKLLLPLMLLTATLSCTGIWQLRKLHF